MLTADDVPGDFAGTGSPAGYGDESAPECVVVKVPEPDGENATVPAQ